MPLLWRSSGRYLLRHPWQSGLSVLGIAIAVAVVVGIDLANASAERAFRLSVEGVAGKATHEIAAGRRGVDEDLYRRLRADAGLRRLAPVVEAWVRSDDLPDRPLRLFGIDPFAEAPFRDFTRTLRQSRLAGDLDRFLIEPGAALVSPDLAAGLGITPGESFAVRYAGRDHNLTLLGLLEAGDELGRSASRDLVVVDIASAQEVLGMAGLLSRIDLLLDGDGDMEAVRELLPGGAELRSKSARSGVLDDMTRAFRLNLRALSLLALLVGMFLIYNAVTFSVVQRRALVGTLRALGVTRRQVFGLVLGEAAMVAVVGSAAGLALGTVLAHNLLELMVRTINDLYFVLTVRDVAVTPWGLLKGLGLGLGGTLLSALIPAREATRAAPSAVLQRSQLEVSARRSLPRLVLTGAGLWAVTAGLLAIPTKNLPLSFAAIFLFVLGFACLVPAATYLAMHLLRPLSARLFGILGAMAARAVATTLSRTGVAVAALVIAVAMTVGVAIMVRSFRATLVDWLEVTLQADVYVTSLDVAARGQGRPLDPRFVAGVSTLDEVDYVTTYRRLEASSRQGPANLTVLGIEEPAFRVFTLASGRRADAWQRFRDGALLVSEPFAFHRDLATGDTVELLTDSGYRAFEIAGIFYDYASDRGLAMLHRRTYDRYWNDPAVESLGVFAAGSGVDAEDLAGRIRELAGAPGGASARDVHVAPNRDLRRGALAIFDRTFLITEVLRLLAVGIAFIGILSALMALQLERAREFGVLRANGLTPAQVWGLVTAQTGFMGLVSGLLAAPLGVALATLLIEVINRRSFGWTLRMDVSPGLLLQAVLLALLAALLAGVYPAYKLSRTSPSLALREE